MDLRPLVRLVPDFPKPGILFRDITPLLQNPAGFRAAIEQLAAGTATMGSLDYVVGIESRGFILGAALAQHLGLGFVPVRKPGKLPPPVLSQSYTSRVRPRPAATPCPRPAPRRPGGDRG
jgi:adenine phosphoribosyltransferase